jgi:hypothetical protein
MLSEYLDRQLLLEKPVSGESDISDCRNNTSKSATLSARIAGNRPNMLE